jgi:DeoR/GlpR family transcriptional regulator of sugar metabolism
MFAEERHNAIRKIVREHRRLNFAQLHKLVRVSPATLRRDLTDLEKSGDILRVHGGVLDPAYVKAEISYDERVLRHPTGKKHIATLAVSLIPSGSSVFVDAGSTCLEAGKMLLGREDVKIITHSVTLLTLALHGKADVLCLGGTLRRVSAALVGAGVLGALSHIRADYGLIGTSGASLEGCFTTELAETDLKQALLSRAKRTILLADQSKWNSESTIRFATWEMFDDWVTDGVLPPKERRALESQGVKIHKA